MKKERIDKLLVSLKLAPSRERAQAYLMAGRVLVNDEPVTKAGALVAIDSAIRLKGDDLPFVSRGGLKLHAALDQFHINPKGQLCLDIGASTGGFTDCLLQAGAAFVIALDVGTNQLDLRLRQHSKVRSLEQVNFRHVTLEQIGTFVDLAVIDVSFISLRLILPVLFPLLTFGGQVIALVKPQFEVGKEKVGAGGLVKDEKDQKEALEGIQNFAETLGFQVLGSMPSPIQGKKSGNLEWLLWLKKPH